MKKRIISLTLILLLAFSSLSLRLYLLGVKNIYSVSTTNTLKTNTIAKTRGNVYDRNLNKITNSEEKYIACIKPTAKGFLESEKLTNKNTISACFTFENRCLCFLNNAPISILAKYKNRINGFSTLSMQYTDLS
ncbi:MAG: hypothetical protein IIW72_06890, partial [Clostridia bacterium]|nr:hypothetical protein [Clostridia bacterium]